MCIWLRRCFGAKCLSMNTQQLINKNSYKSGRVLRWFWAFLWIWILNILWSKKTFYSFYLHLSFNYFINFPIKLRKLLLLLGLNVAHKKTPKCSINVKVTMVTSVPLRAWVSPNKSVRSNFKIIIHQKLTEKVQRNINVRWKITISTFGRSI